MGLHTIPQHIETSWREPPEYDDPLEHVDHPRERKPWKRDRHSIQWMMQLAINERCAANWRERPNGWSGTADHSLRFQALNQARYEVFRLMLSHKIGRDWRREWGGEAFERAKRYILVARKYDVPPLPDSSPPTAQGGVE